MPRKPPAAPPPDLNYDGVIAAALAWIDEYGLDRFSVRALAKELGVFPAAIYWYVPTRDLILAEVVAEVLRGFVPAWGGGDWRIYVAELLHRFRAAVRLHPNVAPLIGTQLLSNTSIDLVLAERNLAALRAAGFTGARLIAAHNTLMAALVGFTTQEFAPLPAELSVWQDLMQERIDSIDASAYPEIAAQLPGITNRAFVLRWQNGVTAPLDDSFDFFVGTIVAGLEAMAAA